MKNYQEFLSDFEKLIACESVQGEPKKGKPFGEGVSKAYETFKNICIKLGFKVTDYDGYMGEATVGEGEELGVIGHLDVVPVSGNWQTDPFKLTLKDGKFYGRGVMDDKGPLLVCLYALKEVVDEYKTLNRKVRFLFGTNEESGWGDVDYFKTVSHFPEEGFSPDGNFPVIYAEKGPNRIIFDIDYKGKFTCFSGGTAVNAVCDYATVKGTENKELLAKYGLTVKDGKIESVGKACHGSNPRGGKNAIKPLLEYINELENGCFKDVIDYLFNDKLNIFGIGNETGYATISPDIIESTPTGIKLVCDFRVPAKMNLNDFLPLFDKTGLRYTAVKGRDPLFVDKDCDFVKKLLSAYNQATGENESALSIAGATYSSVFNKGVAFGPELHGDDGAIHQPNEYLPVSTLEVMFNVYKQAFVNLLTK